MRRNDGKPSLSGFFNKPLVRGVKATPPARGFSTVPEGADDEENA